MRSWRRPRLAMPADGALDRGTLDALREGRHGNPFAVLGMHEEEGRVVVRAMLPWARKLAVIEAESGEIAAELPLQHRDGLFAGAIPGRDRPFRYRLRAEGALGPAEFEDIYRFPPVLGELDVYLLAEGSHLRSWEKLGAHP